MNDKQPKNVFAASLATRERGVAPPGGVIGALAHEVGGVVKLEDLKPSVVDAADAALLAAGFRNPTAQK